MSGITTVYSRFSPTKAAQLAQPKDTNLPLANWPGPRAVPEVTVPRVAALCFERVHAALSRFKLV